MQHIYPEPPACLREALSPFLSLIHHGIKPPSALTFHILSSTFIMTADTQALKFPTTMTSDEDDGVDGFLTIQRALDIARNCEEIVEPTISSFLEQSLDDLWSRIYSRPNTYLMSRDEFALFNYFRYRYAKCRTAQRAVQRFWDNYYGDVRDMQRCAEQLKPRE